MAVIATWASSTASLQAALFKGDQQSIDQLDSLLKDGKFLANGYTQLTDPQIQDQMAKALNTILIPVAWAFAPDHAPFIINSQVSCSKAVDQGVSDSDFPKDKQKLVGECYNDKWYYIASAAGPERVCRQVAPIGTQCDLKKLSVPPGMDKLDGKLWAGITIRNLTVA